MNGPNDLTQIDIVLTDFGLAGQNTIGGTPIFASPECFSVQKVRSGLSSLFSRTFQSRRSSVQNVKTNASDIFSLGRVFLFMTLPKESFLKVLFIPIISSADTLYLANAILNQG